MKKGKIEILLEEYPEGVSGKVILNGDYCFSTGGAKDVTELLGFVANNLQNHVVMKNDVNFYVDPVAWILEQDEIVDLIKRGQTLEAIKLVRWDEEGKPRTTLKPAHDFVKEAQAKLRSA